MGASGSYTPGAETSATHRYKAEAGYSRSGCSALDKNTFSPAVNRTTIPRIRISLLYNGYGDSPGVKRLRREDEHSPASIAEFKNAYPLLNAFN
jgi:hypothetical protein